MLPRFATHGGSKLYACWVDESHNNILRELCRYSHRVTFERRTFSLLKIQFIVQSASWLVLTSQPALARSRRPC